MPTNRLRVSVLRKLKTRQWWQIEPEFCVHFLEFKAVGKLPLTAMCQIIFLFAFSLGLDSAKKGEWLKMTIIGKGNRVANAISLLITPTLYESETALAKCLADITNTSTATNRVALSNLKGGRLRFNDRWQSLLLQAFDRKKDNLSLDQRSEIERRLHSAFAQIRNDVESDGEQFDSGLQLTDSIVRSVDKLFMFVRSADYETKIAEAGNIFSFVFSVVSSSNNDWPEIRVFVEPDDYEYFFERVINCNGSSDTRIAQEESGRIGKRVVVFKSKLVEHMTRSILTFEKKGVRSYYDLFAEVGRSRNDHVSWKRLASLPRVISSEMNRAPQCLAESGVNPQALITPSVC